ncbi:MAG: hypothetical protein ABI972_21740 [Acidobacteriota bacterium]
MEYPEAQNGLHAVIEKSRKRGETAYIYVNNRLETNPPEPSRAVVLRGETVEVIGSLWCRIGA